MTVLTYFATVPYIVFGVRRETKWNLQVTVSPEVLPYNDDFRLLLVNVALKNVGNVKIASGSKGCWLSVKKLQKDIRCEQTLEWQNAEIFVKQIDILRYYRSQGGYKRYEIEPRCEYHELETLIVSKGDILLIEVEFWWFKNRDSITEYRVIFVE